MIKKMLTHLIILALTVLPVQVISASAENVSMQISMNQQVSVNNECLHEISDQKLISEIKNNSTANACCDDQSSSCQGCNDIPQATIAMTPPVITLVKISLLTSTKLFANNSLLHGIPQKNILRPPRNLI